MTNNNGIQLSNKVLKDRFHDLLAQANLPLQIADMYKDYMASVRQLECENGNQYSQNDEAREAESQAIIQTLMLTALSESLFLTTKHLFIKCSTLVRTGKPLNKSQSRKLAEEFTAIVDGDFFIASDKGGARRKRKSLQSIDERKAFAKKVNSLHPLWEKVIEFYAENGYEAGCDKIVKQKYGNVPDELLKAVFKKKNKNSDELSPQGLAIQHAALELKINYKFNTLKRRYYEGERLLNKNRK